MVLLQSDCATPSDGRVFLQRDRVIEDNPSRQPDLDCSAEFFFVTIWPLIEFLRSLVVYVNHHNKDYLRKTPCDWLCSDDAAFVNTLTSCLFCMVVRGYTVKYMLIRTKFGA